MPKIVISYRRSDSDAMAGRIRDRLAARYGDDSLFMDIDNIPFGTDFRDHIRSALLSSDVVIVVVGPKWLGPGKGGRLRIKDETDPVRIEVETALQGGLPLVPVLVGGAHMPAPSDLPDSLKDFAFRNAAEIETGRDFHPHMDRLIRSIDRILQGPDSISPSPAEQSPAGRSSNPGERNESQSSPAAFAFDSAASVTGPSKKPNRTVLVVAAACATALLLGLGLGLFLFRGPAEITRGPTQPGEQVTQDSTKATPAPACSSETPAALLDDSKVPEPGPALEAALKNAVALYFMCQSLPIERFARSFATLSVVLAQYAPDVSCFKGDAGAAGTDWSGHKGWADRQGSADLLMANMRLKIGLVLACLPPEQQGLLYADFARAFAFAAAGQSMQTFVNPVFRGQRVDRCLYFARDCNEPAALAWCQRYGYSRMTKWEWVYVPRTVTLGDQKACAGSCGAFTTIICAQ